MCSNLIKLLFALFAIASLSVKAQTMEVSGEQSGTWSGNVIMTGDVTVNEGNILTIAPGTSVVSDGSFSITVTGGLSAIGTAESPITFTVADTTGFHDYETVSGGWGGIEFRKCKEGVVLEYCDFSYGKTPLGGNGAGVRFFGVNGARVHNCVFHDNIFRAKGGGVYASKSTIEVVGCEAYNNEGYGYDASYTYGGGFYFINCNVDIENMISHDNYIPAGYGGGCSFDSCNVVLNNAVFYNNYATNGGGLGLQRSKHLDVKMSNVLAYNNEVVHYGGGMAMATASPEINNFTIVNNICGGGGGAGMQISFESNPQINNTVIYDNHAIYYDQQGVMCEYYLGSQVWLWGDDNFPLFRNGIVQYGYDTIQHSTIYTQDFYVNMSKENPKFIDVEEHNYHLSDNSPAINAGIEDISGMFIPETDLDGNPRVFNGRIDMGCFEWNNLSVSELTSYETNIKVTPNPLNANSVATVSLENPSNATMRLVTLDGKEVGSAACGQLEAGENMVPLNGLIQNIEKNNKMYLLIIYTQDNRFYSKIVY